MKKLKNIFSLLVVALVGLSLTACSNDDLGTNQYQGGVSLNAYGPNPVMRGGQLRFVGSNLDQIASITIPGVGEITNIEVIKSGVPSEIRITVPKDGPKVGYVTLKTKTDQTITTKSQIEYIEGIEVTKIPEETVMPGQTIRIEGDYLNLINSLAFADGVLVSANDFVEQDRYYIDVIVPEEAKTGKLEFYTADLTIQRTAKEEDELTYQTIVSDDALNVGLPSVSKITSPRGEAEPEGEITVKAGEEITLAGDYYNLVSAIKFGDIEVTDFIMSEDGTALKFKLPAEAPAGVFSLVCKSEEEVPVATLVTVKPTECVAAPQPVKAGDVLQVDGKDMDLVVDIEFADAKGEYTINNNQNIINTTQAYAVKVPETATEGNLKLVMANGERIEVAFTLVKPVATAYNANPVSAGAELQIKGTNLDLVKSVTFGEAVATVEEGAVSADGTTLTVKVPMDAKSGKPILNLANEDKIEAPELNINEAVFCYITEMPVFDDDNTPAAGDLFTVPVANADVLTNVYVNGTEAQFAYSPKTKMLSISIPENAKPSSVLKFVSSNGEIEYTIPVIPNTEINTTIWTGAWEIDWGGDLGEDHKSLSALAYGGYDWSAVKEGTDLTVFFTEVEGTWWQMRLGNGSWAALPGTNDQYDFETGINKFTVTLTADMLKELTNNGGLVITGHGLVISKVVLTEHISLEETLWSGSMEIDWNVGGALTTLSWGGYDWASVKAGKILRIYYEKVTSGAWGCASLRHGDGWGNLPDNFGSQYDFPEDSGVWEIALTQEAIDDLAKNGQGLIITGTNFIIKKVTLE